MSDAKPTLTAHDVPGLGERRTKALKIHGASDWWFYPLLLAIAAVLVAVSLGAGVFERPGRAQTATIDGAVHVFGAQALADGMVTRNGHVLHVAREFGLSPRAVRIGARPGMGLPLADRPGAQLLLAPEEGARLQGKALRLEVAFRRLNVTSAASLAIGAETGGPITWITQPIPAENGVMIFDLPATASPPTAIGFWVVNDQADYTHGVEISRVRVTPAG